MPDPRTQALAEIGVAIRQDQWAQAEGLIQTFAAAHPGDDAATRLGDELARAKQAAIETLTARIDAARTANDLERIFEARAALVPLHAPDAMRSVDRDLGRWFLGLIHKRLRTGLLTVDVAVLAFRVAETFDTTPEGASLRAALPTLRRSVGLCARCGQPYSGIADACPACLATSSFPVYIPPSAEPANHGGLSRPSEAAPSETIAPELE